MFAFVRWASNDFGTIVSRMDIVRAVEPGVPYQTLPFVRPGGEILRAIVAWQGRSGAIYRACERIRLDYAKDLDVGTLASEAAMSTSAFHHAFKLVTGASPIQYIKATRLQRAHELIKLGRLGVAHIVEATVAAIRERTGAR